ncbi:unnamed protein product [Cylindrotheca closterium]|uniref:Uncharacterized protein n=1 Tax=Cylindrotheca closterium TaxID=2856 RepID=A0AAD2CSC7_9STRA|nr:unnamed protein product [Cylindrotheca closterium]
MSGKSNDLNGKVYGRRNRLLLMPKEKEKEKSKQHQRPKPPLMSSNPRITEHGFRRSPHLQAVMDRIERRRKIDREKEIRWQEASRRRRNRQTDYYSSQDGGREHEQDLSDVLEIFAEYDNMLEHLVLKNMELMNLAEKKSEEIPDDETALTEKVLNDLRTLRQHREQQQFEDKPLNIFSEVDVEFELSNSRTAGNPYLRFTRPNECHGVEQISRQRTKFTPKSTGITSSFSNRKRLVVDNEEIRDSLRLPLKTTAITAAIPKPKNLLDNGVSGAKRIRELRKLQQTRREAQVQILEEKVQDSRHQTDESSKWQFEDREGKTKEEQAPEPRQQADAHNCKIERSGNETRKPKLSGGRHNQEQMETFRNEMEEWWMCPVDILERRPLPPRNSHKVTSKIDPQTDESDSDSFGPSREAKKLKKRLNKIYQQNKSLKSAQEDMRGEMLQLKQGYKLKHRKLKSKFLRNAALSKQYQNEARESDHRNSQSGVYGQRDDNISYEVRDGVIVLDDFQDGAGIPEFEFLGVRSPRCRPELPVGSNYMLQPITHITGETHGQVDQELMDQHYMHQPVMELPFSPEEQAQFADAERTYDQQGHEVVQPHSQNHHGGRDEDETDDDDSMTYDSQSAYTIEHYQPRREPAWNCASEL